MTLIETIPQASELSMIEFDPSQRRMFEDRARVIVVNWHRQKGKDFTAAAKAIDQAMSTGQDWYIVSLTQRQADATFEKCRRVARAFERMLKIVVLGGESEYGSEQFDRSVGPAGQWFKFTARVIHLPNGARVISLPGRDPDTLAGLTGNVIFTEFGLFPNGGYEHWKVVFPLTTRGFSCIVISTPRGRNTKFYELWSNPDGQYSVHTCDIHKSVAEDGFVLRDNRGEPCTIEQFKKLYNDAAGWPREYECQFTGDLSSLILWAQLERAAELGKNNPDGFVFRMIRDKDAPGSDASALAGSLRGTQIEVGWDVARRGHLSAIAVNKAAGPNQPRRLIAVIAMRNCSFEFQRAMVSGIMDTSRLSVGFGDATGLGMESNEVLEKKYGGQGGRWTPFTFTGTGKREIASALVTAFSDGTQTLPPLDGAHKFIATDLYAIQKDDTGANLMLEETPNPLLEESHCDIGYAIGLMRLAGAKNARIPLPAPLLRKPVGF